VIWIKKNNQDGIRDRGDEHTSRVQKENNSVAPEPEGSSPHSQQPASDPHPEPRESTPHTPANVPKVHFDPILPSTPWSFK
jgi:hypothetical protein